MQKKKAVYINVGKEHGVMSSAHGLKVFKSKNAAYQYINKKNLIVQ